MGTGDFEVYYQRIKMGIHFFMVFDYYSSIISFLSSNHSKNYEKWIISQCCSFWMYILYILANRKERTEMQVACFVLLEKYGSTALGCRLFIRVLRSKESHLEDYNFTCHSIHSFLKRIFVRSFMFLGYVQIASEISLTHTCQKYSSQ